ncbi:MAG: TIGR00282 family metallophosphoesterase [Pseudomonadota bacterium]
MNLAFFGDVVGRAGRKAVSDYLPGLRKRLSLDAVIINAENAAGGFGITAGTAEQLFDAGADVLTMGNHTFDQPQGISLIDNDPRILRPANYPPGTPGHGANLYDVNGYRMLVISLHGRVFMDALDDPFQAAERELAAAPLGEVADLVIVDMHAEATSEKKAMGYFCDGRATLVVGSHQHTPTADAMILPEGTAYQTDAGMCGDYQSIIGMEIDEPLRRFTTRMRSARFEPASGPATLCGVFVQTNAKGLATRIEPIRMGGQLAEHLPHL